jgi:hypothetical protein
VIRLWAVLLLVLSTTGASADDRRRVDITNPALIATEHARGQLKYLASCALDDQTILTGVHDGTRFEFPGSMGLAPAWGDRELTVTERRWVSACILARTNFFGAPVLISMRAPLGVHAVLSPTADELASHTLYEGGFFGDLFLEMPEAYVCVGPDHDADRAAQTKRKRVCTHVDPGTGPGTRCGFVHVGQCPNGEPPHIRGQPWTEVIHVWLSGTPPDGS